MYNIFSQQRRVGTQLFGGEDTSVPTDIEQPTVVPYSSKTPLSKSVDSALKDMSMRNAMNQKLGDVGGGTQMPPATTTPVVATNTTTPTITPDWATKTMQSGRTIGVQEDKKAYEAYNALSKDWKKIIDSKVLELYPMVKGQQRNPIVEKMARLEALKAVKAISEPSPDGVEDTNTAMGQIITPTEDKIAEDAYNSLGKDWKAIVDTEIKQAVGKNTGTMDYKIARKNILSKYQELPSIGDSNKQIQNNEILTTKEGKGTFAVDEDIAKPFNEWMNSPDSKGTNPSIKYFEDYYKSTGDINEDGLWTNIPLMKRFSNWVTEKKINGQVPKAYTDYKPSGIDPVSLDALGAWKEENKAILDENNKRLKEYNERKSNIGESKSSITLAAQMQMDKLRELQMAGKVDSDAVIAPGATVYSYDANGNSKEWNIPNTSSTAIPQIKPPEMLPTTKKPTIARIDYDPAAGKGNPNAGSRGSGSRPPVEGEIQLWGGDPANPQTAKFKVMKQDGNAEMTTSAWAQKVRKEQEAIVGKNNMKALTPAYNVGGFSYTDDTLADAKILELAKRNNIWTQLGAQGNDANSVEKYFNQSQVKDTYTANDSYVKQWYDTIKAKGNGATDTTDTEKDFVAKYDWFKINSDLKKVPYVYVNLIGDDGSIKAKTLLPYTSEDRFQTLAGEFAQRNGGYEASRVKMTKDNSQAYQDDMYKLGKLVHDNGIITPVQFNQYLKAPYKSPQGNFWRDYYTSVGFYVKGLINK